MRGGAASWRLSGLWEHVAEARSAETEGAQPG
jgi:hypothetical protein